jgi:hypothetical protein
MKRINHIYAALRLFVIISLATGAFIILFSLFGKFIHPGNLIPFGDFELRLN